MMYCSNCGKELNEGSEFCPNCGAPVEREDKPCVEEIVEQPAGQPIEEPVAESIEESAEEIIEQPIEEPAAPQTEMPEAPVVAPVEEAPKKEKKKKKWLIPVIIAAVIVIIGGIFAGLYFGTDLFKKDAGDNAGVTAEAGGACRECNSDIDTGYYCAYCIENIGTVGRNNYTGVCKKCYLSEFDGSKYAYFLESFRWGTKLSNEEIFLIDKNGYFYCSECQSEKLCKECEGFLSPDDDDDICALCASYSDEYRICNVCAEVINKFSNFCEECEHNEVCSECGIVLLRNDDDEICYSCADFCCSECDEVLKESEISHYANYGEYFCKDCDTGKYCTECGYTLDAEDDDEVCYSCADYYCVCCDDVLTKDEISYTFEDEWGYEHTLCSDCDTGKYCNDCGSMLIGSDDDNECRSCAEYSCENCNEVLTKNEISHGYEAPWGGIYYYCEDCDTGEYCDKCDRILEENGLCLDCAKKCVVCDERFADTEITYKYEATDFGETWYYCEDCDTGLYCPGCGYVLYEDDDDDMCHRCAEYSCKKCLEVLTEDEISLETVDEWGNAYYYCSICDPRDFCVVCGEAPVEEGEWVCINCKEAEAEGVAITEEAIAEEAVEVE